MHHGRGPRPSPYATVERYLAHGERVIYILRRHTVVLESAVGIWLLALGLGVGAGAVSSRVPSWHLGVIGGWIVLAGAGVLAFKTWAWWQARYVITNERVLLVEGVLNRRVRAIPLSKVTHTDFNRSFFGRMFGYGQLALDSPGGSQNGLRELTSIPKPDEIYRLIMSLVAGTDPNAGGPGGPGGGGDGPSDPALEDTGPLPRLIL